MAQLLELNNAQISNNYLVRPRINELLAKALEKPLIAVVAGAGYGKTRAVYDFMSKSKIPYAWMQLSALDNVGSRFWGSFSRVAAQLGEDIASELTQIGFPDTEDKLTRVIELRDRVTVNRPYNLILDDVHLINNPAVLRFIERHTNDPNGNSTIIICRELPKINIAGLEASDLVYGIYEEDLNFTKSELDIYFAQQGLSVKSQALHEIYQDTHGWAFSVNLIARSLKKTSAYSGYVRTTVKERISELMETEVWNVASRQLKRFWLRISLIEHLSSDLIVTLAGGNEDMLSEFRQRNAYIRLDKHIGAYLIHHLFLDFLRTKQEQLTEDEKRETYEASAKWCEQNGFTVDAIGYYEKIGGYEAIVSILFKLSEFFAYDFALKMAEIFKAVPTETFTKVDFLAAMHLRALISLGHWQEAITIAEHYERQLKELPEDNILRKHTLCLIYFFWGTLRVLMSTADHRYDFDKYFAKMYDCRTDPPIQMGQMGMVQIGPWISMVGSSRQGAPQEFTKAALELLRSMSSCFGYAMGESDDIFRGEMLFYQGDIAAAGPLLSDLLVPARNRGQFEYVHRSLLYTMRIAVLQGKREKALQALKDIESLLDEKEYSLRFVTCDIAIGWYYYLLRQPQMVPNWLKEKFSPYSHPIVLENFGNQMKARYCYLTKNYEPLLAYIEEMKRRESALYGRVEMLAMEACARYQMKDKKAAADALLNAYEEASPNGVIMPFIELGKDMRTLTDAALRDPDQKIPQQWLKNINNKSILYAKHQKLVISDYEKEHGKDEKISLSPRELKILHDLYNGFSRQETADKQKLSLNTVKLNINSIYEKLNADTIADAIRIAVERKLLE